MAHKGETQSTSDEMPRIPHTIQRGGVYYFNARYPSELVERGVVRKVSSDHLSQQIAALR
jgi:hypothetical protein